MTTRIVWFRRDLRLADNPALRAALAGDARVVCVYVHAPDEEAPWLPGAASRWWLHRSLAALGADLRSRGAALVIRRGPSAAALAQLAVEVGAEAVHWNRLYEPASIARDDAVREHLRARGVDVVTHNAALLFEPDAIATAQGQPYRVFTPFWRQARARLEVKPVASAPKRIAAATVKASLPLDDLGLLPRIAWDGGLKETWTPGAAGAHEMLEVFQDDALSRYVDGRDRPDRHGTSRLSPYLHFGEISPREILYALSQGEPRSGKRSRGGRSDAASYGASRGEVPGIAEKFVQELGWREFSHHLLVHFPHTSEQPLDVSYKKFPWAKANEEMLDRWRHGRTGIPIVDAGMRELWQTGWMHNRVRMLVASFLTKHLRLHWLHGARWFWDTLVDADLANNTQGWQWTAGSGADAAPYFRVFNPVTQGERFDPLGAYVRRYVPALQRLPDKFVQQPWKLDPEDLRHLGAGDYPAPMVDLAAGREAALSAWRRMRADASGSR